jgi:DsbC/DsbD-like thiol-disulfide interchange protein
MRAADTEFKRKMPRRVRALSSCVLCFVLCAFAKLCAEPLSIELVSEVTSIQPGKPFYVGLHLKHQEHYHTYWKFPGIVGVPTDMAWKLPPGWKAGPIEWPAPERVMMFQIKAQGYHGEVLLPMKITPPKELVPGAKVTLQGKATWMCCGLDCNPGFTDLSLTLPVEQLPPPLDTRWEALFSKARADLPQPLAGFEATATRDGQRVTLRVTPQPEKKIEPGSAPSSPPARNQAVSRRELPDLDLRNMGKLNSGVVKVVNGKMPTIEHRVEESPGIFFTEDGYINADKDQTFRQEDDALVIELPISTYFTDTPPAELRGILWLKDGSLGKGAIIRAPFAK